MLQTMERALAGEHGAVAPLRRAPAGEQRRIMTQIIVVADILVAERNADDPLADQARQIVDHEFRRAVINETGGSSLDQSEGPISMPKQSRTSIRRQGAALEIGDDAATANTFKFELLSPTVCRHRRFRWFLLTDCGNSTLADHGRRCTITGENCGLTGRDQALRRP